jgi:hypothetical protein
VRRDRLFIQERYPGETFAEEAYIARSGAGVAPRTINRHLNLLHSLFKAA